MDIVHDPFSFLRTPHIPGDEGNLIREATRLFANPHQKYPYLGQESGRNMLFSYLIGILIPKLSHLEVLDWQVHDEEYYLVEKQLQAALSDTKSTNTPTTTRNLKIGFFYRHTNSTCFTSFLLPSTSISLRNMRTDENYSTLPIKEKRFSDLPARSSDCTSLELRSCWFTDEDFDALLAVPKKLTTLIYELDYMEDAYQGISFQALRAALDRHKNSLENLGLGYGQGIQWKSQCDETHAMKSLRDFTALKRLRIAPEFIFGAYLVDEREGLPSHDTTDMVPFLPSQIEVLHITDVWNWGVVMLDGESELQEGLECHLIFNAVRGLMLSKEAEFPSLREVILDVESQITKDPVFDRMLSSARQCGVKIVQRFPYLYVLEQRNWGIQEETNWEDLYQNIQEARKIVCSE